MKIHTFSPIQDFDNLNDRALWSAYWIKPQYYHYQLRLPVRYASNLDEWEDPSNHYQLDEIDLRHRFERLPIISAWVQQEDFKTYLHWQCHVVTTRPLDTNLVRTVMYPECFYKINCYCKAARVPWDSMRYCTKISTRVMGPYFYNATYETPNCRSCNDEGCLLCSPMLLNAL